MQATYKAFLFDLNGTMVDDMHYHIAAWHHIFNTHGADISLAQTKAECYGKNEELIHRIFPNKFSEAEIANMIFEKEFQYRTAFAPHLQLIDGLPIFLEKARQASIKMAIGTAAIQANVDFVVDGLQLQPYFDAYITADTVSYSKPHPETFLKCAAQLGIQPADCVVFEDSPKGVECAANAGIQAVVLTTMHTAEEFAAYTNIIGFVNNYTHVFLNQLFSQ